MVRLRYADKITWGEDTRRINNDVQFLLIRMAALDHPPSTL